MQGQHGVNEHARVVTYSQWPSLLGTDVCTPCLPQTTHVHTEVALGAAWRGWGESTQVKESEILAFLLCEAPANQLISGNWQHCRGDPKHRPQCRLECTLGVIHYTVGFLIELSATKL